MIQKGLLEFGISKPLTQKEIQSAKDSYIFGDEE